MDDAGTSVEPPDQRTAADEAFKLLSDGTRLAVLEALWAATQPTDSRPVPFSEIRDRLDIDDSGRLNYHLGELADHFIRRTDEGYELRQAGERIMRVVISGAAVDGYRIDPTEIDVACIFCGGETEVSYEAGQLAHRCRSCSSRCVASYPPSLLSRTEVPPAGLLHREPDEVYRSVRRWIIHRETAVMDGVCPECAGQVAVTDVRICDDHRPDPAADEVCAGCGSIFWGLGHHVCEVCKFHMQLPTTMHASMHPAVDAFFHAHGVDLDLGTHEHRGYLLDYREEVVSEDPLRIRTTIPLDGDELQVELDDQLTVVEVAEV